MRHPIIRHSARVYSFAGIINAIETAQVNGLKRVAIRFENFIVKPSKYDGKVYVFSHDKELNQWGTLSNKYLGWLTASGTNLGDAELIAAAQVAAADPATAAKAYGIKTGTCSCCGRTLTDPKSISAGIGPICADRFGL
jgi:hypothetical protein